MSQIKLKEPARPARTWKSKIVWALGVFVLLGLALYFIVTSATFLQRVVLPQVSKAINSDVTVSGAEISPFQRVTLHDLKVHPRGGEPLLTVKEIRLRYSLLAIVRGKIDVTEVAVDSPVITVVKNADGTSNLDELLKLGGSDQNPPTEPGTKAPVVDVKLVALNNATVRLTTHHEGGTSDVTEISGLNFSLRDLKNGQTGKMEVAALLAVNQAAQAAAPASSLRAKLGGGFTFDLLADLKPGAVKGDLTFSVEQATGALAELGQVAARLDCEMTPTEIRQIALRCTKAETQLGEVRLAGPLDLAKLEGKLKLEVASLDRRVLNLAGAASGLDFGPTTINSITDIELAKSGKVITVGGRLNVANLQVTQLGKTSPTLDLRCDYAATIDQAAEAAVLKTFNLSGTQNAQPFLQSELPQPLPIAWGAAHGAGSEAAFNLAITSWNLADWRAFAGDIAPAGLVNAKLNLVSRQDGKQLQLLLTGGVENLAGKFGSNQISQAELRWKVNAQATDLKQFKLDDVRLEMLHQGQSAVVATATGTFDAATQASDLQLTLQVTPARLLALAPQPEMTVTSGAVDFKARLVGKETNQTVTGQLALTEFTGRGGELSLNRFGVALDFDASRTGSTFELRKVAGQIRESDRVGGRLEASGKFDLAPTPPVGQVAVKLVDFNQDGLRPFLQLALGDKRLVSVALTTTVNVILATTGEAAVKADAQITNLVVSDPANPALATPLQARLQVDAGMLQQRAEVRQFQVTLTPSERAKNELNLTGNVDLSQPEAITGRLLVKADSLDLTRYYDLFAGKAAAKTPDKSGKPTSAPPAPAPEPEQEPPALKLPFRDFTFAVDLGRLYLREIDVAKLLATAKIDGSHVLLKPCQLTLNGAPLSATVDADVGVPGYRYQVDFNAQALPLVPLVDTFAPDLVGQIGGQLTASAAIRGAGITGGSLQTNLTGQFDVLATNLNLSISNVRSPIVNTILNIIVGLPELIRNPAALIGAREAGQKTGWADDIAAQPIQLVRLQGQAGAGKITVQPAVVQSAAFRVQLAGDLTIAPVLTNSVLHFPVNIALGRRYADKIGLVNASTPTNEVYLALPDFLTLKNTVGNPKPEISKLGIAAVVAKTGGGIAKQLGLATGDQGKSVFNAVGGLLGGNSATNAPPEGTNNAAPPQNPVGGLIDLFKKPKK